MDYTIFLPDHILTYIFGCLTPKTIKRCSLVCKRWDEVISDSVWIMNNYCLCVDKGDSYKLKESNRKHQMIVILNEIGESLDVICQRNLLDLELINIEEVVDSWKFINLLKKLPQLQSLNAIINITDLDIPDDMKAQLDHLNYLICNIRLTRLLNANSLRYLNVNINEDFSSTNFINFLKQQKFLEDLAINGSHSQMFFQSPEIFKLDCELSSFSFISDQPFRHHYEFIKFLQIHDYMLESLIMYCFGESLEIVKEYVLKNMKDLDHLTMSFIDWFLLRGDGSKIEDYVAISHLPEPDRPLFRRFYFPNPINISISLQSLNCALSNNHESNKQLFNAFRNLKSLELISCILNESELKDTLEYASAIMKDLENLVVQEISSSTVQFLRLKSLSVKKIPNVSIFNDFIARHSTILETVQIIEVEDITQETVNELMNCRRLKCLDIESEVVDYRVFNACSLSVKLMMLKLIHKNAVMRFIFPDDNLDWDSFISSFDSEVLKD